MADQLLRETAPPAGQVACPTPQYENADTPGVWERLKGKLNAAFMMLKGANGNLLNVNADGSLPVTGEVEITNASLTVAGSVSLAASIPAGTANIGDVDVASLPSIPSGDNNIGNVDIASALPAGDNNIGNVDIVTLPSLPAGTANIGDVDVASLPSIPSGDNVIGKAKIVDSAGLNVAAVDATGAVKVNVANATIAVTDNSGSLTVDGTVAVNARTVSGTQVGTDITAAWANSAVANTTVTLDITAPATANMQYVLSCYNPSADSDLTVNLYQKKLAFGGDTRYVFLTALNYAKNSANCKVIEPLFVGGDARLIISNDQAVGASNGFTATFRLETVN